MPELESNPFIPASPPTTSSETPGAERPKRGPRKAKEVVEKPARKARAHPLGSASGDRKAAATAKPARKGRAAKATVLDAVKFGTKFDIYTIINAAVGLKEDEATVLLEVVKTLNNLKKSSKPKVLAALDKLFG